MKIKLYLYHQQWAFEKTGTIEAYTFKVDDDTVGLRLRIFLCEHDVDVPDDVALLSEDDIRQIMVTGLRQQKTKVQADAQMKLKEIDDKIQQLLCIEMKAES